MWDMRKLIALLVLVCMLFSMSVCAASEDVKNKSNEDVVKKLSALGILQGYEGGSFNAEETITRAEFAVMITKILGIADTASEKLETTPYTDVPVTHPAAGSIILVSNLGIINGIGEGVFGPDQPVTYQQAVKMLVCTLGYEMYAQQHGGYPIGYLVVAAQEGITKKIDYEGNTSLKRGAAVQLIYNSLEVDIMQQTGFGESKDYSVIKGQNLLSQKLNVQKKTGQVRAIGDTGLISGEITIKDDEVEIDRTIYKAGKTNAKDYLGYRVSFYVKQEKNEDMGVLLYISTENQNYNTFTVNSDDLLRDDPSFTVTNFVYSDPNDNKRKDFKLSSDLDIIYNGRAAGVISVDLLKPVSGKVILLDYDDDNEYDVAFVTEYNTYVVDTASSTDKTVTDKYGKPKLDLDRGSDFKLSLLKDGKNAEVSDLNEWDVLIVEESTDKKLMKIVVVSNPLTGKLTAKGDDTLYIDDKEYDIAENYTTAIKTGNKNVVNIDINDEAIFHLDLDGKIAAVQEKTKQNTKYAYLIKAALSEGVSKLLQVKMFTSDGEMITYDCAEKIHVNDLSALNGEQALAEILKNNNGNIRQLVTYELNNEGKLDVINTAVDATVRGYDTDHFSRDYIGISTSVTNPDGTTTTKMNIKFKFTRFDQTYMIPKDIIVFSAPAQGEDGFLVQGMDALKDGDTYTDCAVYDSTDTKIAKVFVKNIAASDGNPGNTSVYIGDPICYVKKLTSLIDDKGNQVLKLYALQKGADVEYTTIDDVDKIYNVDTLGKWSLGSVKFSELKFGDMVQVGLSAEKKVDKFKILYRITSDGALFYRDESNDGDIQSQVTRARVTNITSEAIVYNSINNSTSTKDEKSMLLSSNTPVYICDLNKKVYKNASLSDITKDTEIIIRSYRFSINEIIIIKK